MDPSQRISPRSTLSPLSPHPYPSLGHGSRSNGDASSSALSPALGNRPKLTKARSRGKSFLDPTSKPPTSTRPSSPLPPILQIEGVPLDPTGPMSLPQPSQSRKPNRPASKSVSSVSSSSQTQTPSHTMTTTTLTTTQTPQPVQNPALKGYHTTGTSTTTTSTTTTPLKSGRSRSTSIALHDQTNDVYARRTAQGSTTADLLPELNLRMGQKLAEARKGLTRRISVHDVPRTQRTAMEDLNLNLNLNRVAEQAQVSSLGLSGIGPTTTTQHDSVLDTPQTSGSLGHGRIKRFPSTLQLAGKIKEEPYQHASAEGPLSGSSSFDPGDINPITPTTPASASLRQGHGQFHGQGHSQSQGGEETLIRKVVDGLGKVVGINLSGTLSYDKIHNPIDVDVDAGDEGDEAPRSWVSLGKRRSMEDSDSEKGLPHDHTPSSSSAARLNKTRPIQGTDGTSYFHLDPYPSSTHGGGGGGGGGSLPTPALSSVSLSGKRDYADDRSRRKGTMGTRHLRHSSMFTRLSNFLTRSGGQGQSQSQSQSQSHSQSSRPPGPINPYVPTASSPEAKAERLARGRSDSLLLPPHPEEPGSAVGMNTALKTVVRDLGWTLGSMGIVFLASFGIVAFGVKSMPITSLHSLPKKVSDLQILSAEIRGYMGESYTGWWHTIAVLMFTGMWKHSWSIPGALILNILVGSLLSPLPALVLLTLITSFGSLGAYMLSRPLAPLIALIFPKPLALVRSALNGSATDPSPKVSPGPQQPSSSVWKRLLVMRAMGLVPWSGMNVACGVVGVNPITFLLTTAAGSASWSYVTASVGDILAQLALPDGAEEGGQTIASLVQDPALIAKMVVLSLISLVPALFKSRSDPGATAPPPEIEQQLEAEYPHPHISPETQAMTPIAPTISFWQVTNFANHLIRKTTRIAATGWRTIAGEARERA